jgi:arylsulfatase A-like enzyme
MKAKPHIVLIVMDTARARNFSCYGYGKNTSPHTDRIAEKGVLYANAISASPWTLPSHVSLFTGLYPAEHGLTEDKILDGKNIYGLSKEHAFPDFLPVLLKNEGYKTLGFSNNPWISRNFGFQKGFDFFYEAWEIGKSYSLAKKIGRKIRKMAPQRFQPVFDNLRTRLSSWDSGADQTLAVMKEWFHKNHTEDRPYFMFFNFIEPHLPYIPPKPYNRIFMDKEYSSYRVRKTNQDPFKFIAKKAKMGEDDFSILRSLYDGEIAYLDTKVKEICDYLAGLDMLDRALLIITSDHGENIGEHDFMGHQFCLYDTLLRVPLVIRHPEFFTKGRVEYKPIQLSDVFFTILDVLNLRIEGRDIRKYSFLNPSYARQIIAEHESPKITLSCLARRFPRLRMKSLGQKLRCIYAGGMKYIWKSQGQDELYDIRKDPQENNDLIQKNAGLALECSTMLNEQWASMEGDIQNKTGNFEKFGKERVNSEVEEKLRELGYI